MPDHFLNLLEEWVGCGWIRPLDRAFVRFLNEQRPNTPDLVLLAAALTSHQLGRGHVCLDLPAVLAQPDDTLALPPEGDAGRYPFDKPATLLNGITLDAWQQCLQEAEIVGSDEDHTPLVLHDGRLYLRRYWRYTRLVAQHIVDRLHSNWPASEDLAVRLDRLFVALRTPSEQSKTQVHWQSVATAIAATSAFSVISGGPGTGKTTTVVHLLGLLQGLALEQGHRLRIRLAAPTGKAAARLTESIGRAIDGLPEHLREAIPAEVITLHRLLGRRPDTRHHVYNTRNPLHVDLLVVDEASMIDLEMMAALLEALPATARLTLLGDKDQLASVEAGSVLGDLCGNVHPAGFWPETVAWIERYCGYRLQAGRSEGTALDQHIVVLQKSHRFGSRSGIGALARAVNTGEPEAVAHVWEQAFDDIAQVELQSAEDHAFARLVRYGRCNKSLQDTTLGYGVYLKRVKAGAGDHASEDHWLRAVLADFNRFQLLSPLRRGTWGVERLNEITAGVLYKAQLISATSGWYSGRPVMVTRNDYRLGLMNGDTGIAMLVRDHPDSERKILKAVFPMADGTLKKVRPSRLPPVETVYAMTVHKSQGAEFDHTALVFPDRMSPVLTRELVYTAVTRSRRRFTLVRPSVDLMSVTVQRRVQRASGLGSLLSELSRL